MKNLFIAQTHRTIRIASAETVVRTKPTHGNKEDEQLFSSEYKKKFDDAYCMLYKNALVISKGSATQLGACIPESVHANHMGISIRGKVFIRSMLYKWVPPIVSRGLLVTDYLSAGYFHWVADVLPKIVLIQDTMPDVWKELLLLLPQNYAKPYCMETLALLGISEEKIVFIPQGCKVRVKELYAVGDILAPCGSGNFRPSLMIKIRTLAHAYASTTSNPSKNAEKKLYVSRKDAQYRYINNEDSITPLLKEHGFEIITTSDMSVLEQITLFQHTKILISLHGAGLTNMLWMKEGTTVAEIRRKNDSHNNCYFSLASALNINYHYSLADSDSGDTHTGSFTWDEQKVQRLLHELQHDGVLS